MHYQHAFHAGNFADVFKHVLLVALLDALSRKDKPWCFLDTHAGAGLYALDDDASAATGEWRRGIGRLWDAAPVEPALKTYLALVRAANPTAADRPRIYPGSPWLAARVARAADRVVACEQVSAVADRLARAVPSVTLHRRDGYEVDSLLPPAEKRGLVLVDPPFERTDEFDTTVEFLIRATTRFSGGVFAFWYPLKNRYAAGRAVRRIVRNGDGRALLDLQFDSGEHPVGRMHACGLAVLNPPYGFAPVAESALQALTTALGSGATFTVNSL